MIYVHCLNYDLFLIDSWSCSAGYKRGGGGGGLGGRHVRFYIFVHIFFLNVKFEIFYLGTIVNSFILHRFLKPSLAACSRGNGFNNFSAYHAISYLVVGHKLIALFFCVAPFEKVFLRLGVGAGGQSVIILSNIVFPYPKPSICA